MAILLHGHVGAGLPVCVLGRLVRVGVSTGILAILVELGRLLHGAGHLELTLELGRRVLLLILAGVCPVGSLLELLHEGGRGRRSLPLGVVLAARLWHVVELLWVGRSACLPGEAGRGDHSAAENVVVLLVLW